ncbi:MAG: hypothetical protein ACK4Y6_10805 [Bacteroidota bacterium]|jgi:hypothetical protein
MKKLTFLFLTISTLTTVFGQNVQVINKNPDTEKHTVNTFEFIINEFNLTEKQKIATLKGLTLNTGKQTIATLFNSFWENANKLGGNSFKLDTVLNSNDTMTIVMTIYYLSELDIKSNLELYPKNMVYVIGDIDKRQTAKKIKFNERKVILNPMEYISYQNTVGSEATVSIGGFLGAKVWIVGKEGRLPKHLSVNGFGVGPNLYNPVGLSFNTGRIYPVDLNFGQFLVSVLKEQK